MAADITEVRVAIRGKLVGDATLVSLLGGPNIFYLRARQPAIRPSIIFFDTADRPDSQVPYQTRVLTLDIFADSVEKASAIGQRVKTLLDKKPVPIPSGDWLVNFMHFSSEIEGPFEEGDIIEKTLEFNYSVYDLTQTV